MYTLLSWIIKTIVSFSFKFQNDNRLLNAALLKRGLVVHFKNYYGPFVSSVDIKKPPGVDRLMPGLRLDYGVQEEFVNHLQYEQELTAFPDSSEDVMQYGYTTSMLGSGDAEVLYGIIRYLKPKRIIEIGAGSSTLIANRAGSRKTAKRTRIISALTYA
jgi:hypothetical protein